MAQNDRSQEVSEQTSEPMAMSGDTLLCSLLIETSDRIFNTVDDRITLN